MTLGDLLPAAAIRPEHRGVEIAGLASDSRAVGPRFAFFAVPGTKRDGLGFLPDAIERGACALVAEREPDPAPAGLALAAVPNARKALAEAAARFHPAQPETIAAVTGTSGKTSVADFTRQIWAKAGRRAAAIGTLGVVGPDGTTYGTLTTPGPAALHASLSGLVEAGVTHAALEASSHGLDQHRLDGVRLSAGAFTNLSRDHLDYHPSVDHYLAAKLRLFEALLPTGSPAVIDAGSDAAQAVIAAARRRGLRVFTVGAEGHDIRLVEAVAEGFATRLRIEHAGRHHAMTLPLAGGFQASNALVAAGLCIATGTPVDTAFGALATLAGAPGRLQFAGSVRGAPVFVDYAHKPDALENVLRTLRHHASGKLVVVFGCGGDRDAGKRPIMGGIAARHADLVIVTDDNPRAEDPARIRSDILREAPGAHEVADRRDAIAAAVASLRRGDVLVVAGKGHETGQIVGAVTLPFSDLDAVRAAIRGEHA